MWLHLFISNTTPFSKIKILVLYYNTIRMHYLIFRNSIPAPICRSTRYTLCRGVMPYDLAGFPVKFRGVDFSAFMPHIEYLVHTNCSNRARQFACALLEPECNPYPHQSKMPCYSLCRGKLTNSNLSVCYYLILCNS